MSQLTPERFALLPLTVFDKLFERTTFVTGWLLEGKIDAHALASALDRLTHKWRMLSGRLHSVKEGEDVNWLLKVPLGPLPANYPTYALTTSISSVSLSHYVTIPIPAVSTSLPPSVFLHASTPRLYAGWESTNSPLTCWNVVYFPASANNGVDYTCIGFSRCHGIFDGGGAAQVMKALVSEIQGKSWIPPPPFHEGLNLNPVTQALEREKLVDYSDRDDNQESIAGYTPLDMAGFQKLIAWHLKEKLERSADRRIVLMPKVALTNLVDETKATLRGDGKQVDHITTGDILVAWIFKIGYSEELSKNMLIHCSNLASFRNLLADTIENINEFPHNAFVPLPYPILSVAEVQSSSLSALTSLFAASRLSLSMNHVISAYKIMQGPCFPNPPNAEETMMISNVTASRILESDWSAIGSKRTLCGYRYQATPTDVLFTNAVYIAGRLDDGSVVLDVTLNKSRFDLLVEDIKRLITTAERN